MGNDIKINNLAYADDIVLLPDDPKDLQSLLNEVAAWCSKWQVSINVNKTKVMVFSNRPKDTNPSFKLGMVTLENVSEYKYLGIVLNERLNTEVTVEFLCKASSRALGQLIGKTKSNYELGYQSYRKLYESTVLPVADFAIGAWNCSTPQHLKSCQKLDQVQQRAIRYFVVYQEHVQLQVWNMTWAGSQVLSGEILKLLECTIKS